MMLLGTKRKTQSYSGRSPTVSKLGQHAVTERGTHSHLFLIQPILPRSVEDRDDSSVLPPSFFPAPLTNQQANMLERLKELVDGLSESIVFGSTGFVELYGPIASGKTTVTQNVIEAVRREGVEVLEVECSDSNMLWSSVRSAFIAMVPVAQGHVYDHDVPQLPDPEQEGILDIRVCTFAEALHLSAATPECCGFSWDGPYELKDDPTATEEFTFLKKGVRQHNVEMESGSGPCMARKLMDLSAPSANGIWTTPELSAQISVTRELKRRWRRTQGCIVVDDLVGLNLNDQRMRQVLKTLMELSKLCRVIVNTSVKVNWFGLQTITLPPMANHEQKEEVIASIGDTGCSAQSLSALVSLVADPWKCIPDMRYEVLKLIPNVRELESKGLGTDSMLFWDYLKEWTQKETFSAASGDFVEDLIILSAYLCKLRPIKLQRLEENTNDRRSSKMKARVMKGLMSERDKVEQLNTSYTVKIDRLVVQMQALLVPYHSKKEETGLSKHWWPPHANTFDLGRELRSLLRSLPANPGFVKLNNKNEIDTSSISLERAQKIALRLGVPTPEQGGYGLLFRNGMKPIAQSDLEQL